jgi:hypothetical protein
MKRVMLLAALVAWSSLASAVVYKWTDAQGKLQYGDRPPDGVKAEVVEMPGNHLARSAPVAAPATAIPGNTAASDKSNADVKKKVDADVAQVKEKQCADAQDRYKKLIEGRRIYKTGADGERQYLTSQEIDQQRIDAKSELDAACTGPS